MWVLYCIYFMHISWVRRNSKQNFFFFFSAYLNPVWMEIMPEWCFLIFWIFLLFFLEFSSSGRVGTKLWGRHLFSLFLGLPQLGLDRNNDGMMFFNFLNFFAVFFWNFLARVGKERNLERRFFLSFSAYLNLVWIEIIKHNQINLVN